MQPTTDSSVPRFVIFEGIDGVGKTTLALALARYYRQIAPDVPLFTDCFPGNRPGSLGEWVYRLHHGKAMDAPAVAAMQPLALQLLHVAAHVDTIVGHIMPALNDPRGGAVILDRFWWSTYVYSRPYLPPDQVLQINQAERVFWNQIMPPIAIYLTRDASLKPHEINVAKSQELTGYYEEVIARERAAGLTVHALPNNGSIAELWATLLAILALPPGPFPRAKGDAA
jgi:thymidylate kinase